MLTLLSDFQSKQSALRKRKEEEKERRRVDARERQKKIFRVYKIPTLYEAPHYCLAPASLYISHISSLQENKKERTNKKRSARNT